MKAKRKLTLSITLVAALLMALLTAGTVLAAEGDLIDVTGTVGIEDIVAGTFPLNVEVEPGVFVLYTVYVGDNFNFDSIAEGDIINVTGIEGVDPLIIILSELKIQERLKDQVKTQECEGEECDPYFCAVDTEKVHPIAEKIALTYGVPFETIMGLLCEENPVSLGQIMLALQTAALTGEDFTTYLTGVDEFHWGQIWQEFDVKGKPDKGIPPGEIKSGENAEGNEDQGQKNNDGEEDSGGFLGLISKWLQKGKK